MSTTQRRHDAEMIKRQAAGHWSGTLRDVCRLTGEQFDPNLHQPCPSYGGTDPFNSAPETEQCWLSDLWQRCHVESAFWSLNCTDWHGQDRDAGSALTAGSLSQRQFDALTASDGLRHRALSHSLAKECASDMIALKKQSACDADCSHFFRGSASYHTSESTTSQLLQWSRTSESNSRSVP